MANIVAVQDLSGIGRCSMNVAISILSAMGHHCIPLPTAILSNQTGFCEYSYLDMTAEIPFILKHWNDRKLVPDAIYTGFLGSGKQPTILTEQLIELYPDAFVLVDPVMGDNGELYSCFDKDYLQEIKRLIGHANMITPNPTELFLLSDMPSETDWYKLSDKEFLQIASRIQAKRLTHVIVTGCRSENEAQNICIDLANHKVDRFIYHDTGVCYSGTGDVFASIVCGAIMRSQSLTDAIRLATDFITLAIHGCHDDCDPRYGIPYESYLRRLTPNVPN